MIHPFDDAYFMRQALLEAERALEEGEVPVGALVVAEDKIIGRGYNQTERLNDATAHAEMIAMTSAANYLGSKYLVDCTLYVTLEPCTMCAGASYWTQMGKIVYGAKDEKRGFTVSGDGIVHPRTEITYGILEKECIELLNIFFKNIRNK